MEGGELRRRLHSAGSFLFSGSFKPVLVGLGEAKLTSVRFGPQGRKAKQTIGAARESLARMVGGRPQDVIFTSGGTEVNGPHGLSSLAAPTVKSDSGSLLVS